jgi:hypothetical protein
MGQLVFQATLGGQVNLVGPNTASTFNINVPAVAGNMVTTGDTGTVSSTMLASGLTLAGSVTYSGGTANGVAYLNGSKVLTTGSALMFDGSNLGLGVTPSAKVDIYSTNNAFNALQVRYNGSNDAMGFGIANSNGFPYIGYNTKSQASSDTPVYERTAAATQLRMDNGAFKFSTAASGTAGNAISFTQAMTLDASGRLVVGNTSTVSKFEVNSGTNLGGLLIGFNGGSSNFYDADTQYFRTGNGTERARIDSSGNLLVGATSAVATGCSYIVGGAASGAIGMLNLRNRQATAGKYNLVGPTNDADPYFVIYNQSSTGVYISPNGNTWASGSDETTKDIIEPITDAAAKVSTLRTVIGKYKTDEEGIRRSFLIAQDVQAVLPEAVSSAPDGTLGLQYQDVIPLLAAAIKEQQALITQLQADVAALKAPQ